MKTVTMRLADAMRLPNPPMTSDQYKKLVKEMGLEAARSKRVNVEVREG
jgi:hypothetical protein